MKLCLVGVGTVQIKEADVSFRPDGRRMDSFLLFQRYGSADTTPRRSWEFLLKTITSVANRSF